MQTRRVKNTAKNTTHQVAPARTDAGFAMVVAAFRNNRQVSYGGKGFGSTALKVNGRIFAMLSSKGQFVIKLPKERVDQLVQSRKGQHFDSGRGKLMKEWLVVELGKAHWLELAREACQFVKRNAF